jgi:hypothetical protein
METHAERSASLKDVCYFPVVGAAVITSGLYLHVTRLFLDAETLLAKSTRRTSYSLVMLPWLGLQLYLFVTVKVRIRQPLFLYGLGAQR